MYIISKNKDYYDGVAGSMGIDKTIVYERHPIEIENYSDIPDEFKVDNVWQHRYENHFYNIGYSYIDTNKTKKYNEVYSFIVGFCGKLYLGWKFNYKIKKEGIALDETKVDIVYGFENAKKFLTEKNWKHNLDDDVKFIENYNPINIFRKINAPIFIVDTNTNKKLRYHNHCTIMGKFIINPLLKDYEFYKLIDSFQAFQEIQMFLSGVLGSGENDIIVVEDKYKISQHGFDKWSFRKEPENK